MEAMGRLWRAYGSKMAASRHKMRSSRRHRGTRQAQDGGLSTAVGPSWRPKWLRKTLFIKVLAFIYFLPQN